jgi:hypothetical protein
MADSYCFRSLPCVGDERLLALGGERARTLLWPNVGGNRRAAPPLAEDQGMNRRVRLTERLGVIGKQVLLPWRGNSSR